VITQLGHTDPALTLRVYAHARRREEGGNLNALVDTPRPADGDYARRTERQRATGPSHDRARGSTFNRRCGVNFRSALTPPQSAESPP
jgi:hypothetical protein